MENNEVKKYRARAKFAWASEGVLLTDEEVEVSAKAMKEAQDELDAGGAREIQQFVARARERARQEGRTYSEVLSEDIKNRHEQYWKNVGAVLKNSLRAC